MDDGAVFKIGTHVRPYGGKRLINARPFSNGHVIGRIRNVQSEQVYRLSELTPDNAAAIGVTEKTRRMFGPDMAISDT